MTLPRLVAVDLDGTLTRLDGTISARTHDALRELRRRGVMVAVATGRPWEVALQTLDGHRAVEADVLVSSNGATTIDLRTRAVLRDLVVDTDLVEPLVARARAGVGGAGVAIETERATLHEPGFAERLPPGVAMGDPVTDAVAAWLADALPVRKVLVFHDDFDHDIAALVAVLAPHLDAGLSAAESGLRCAQIGPAGVSKASALEHVCALHDIDPRHAVAVGDGDNDAEMIAWAGLGVAMGNADRVAVAAADIVVGHTDADGLAAYLESVLSAQQ